MKYLANTQTNVKLNNQKLILHYLTNHEPVSRAKLAEALKSTKPTISKNVDELISVFEDYGRPPQYYKELVTFDKQLDFKEKAVALEIECMAKYAGDGISCSNKQSEAGNTLSAKSFLDALSPPVP